MESDDQKKNEKGRGFAGLSSMVSDVETEVSSAKTEDSHQPADVTEDTPPSRSLGKDEGGSGLYQHPPQQSSSGSSGKKWLIGLVIFIGFIWMISNSGNKNSSSLTSYSTPPSTDPSASAPIPSPVPSRPTEVMPSAGTNNTLDVEQIRYCVAEKIRLDASESAVDRYNNNDVDRFNAMAADFNSRCGQYRYRRGTLERAKSDIEPYRSQLEAEGRSRFAQHNSEREVPQRTKKARKKSFAEASQAAESRPAASRKQRENFETCISGEYPSLCNHAMLTSEEAKQVDLAERRVNFQTCISGEYPALCNNSKLTSEQARQVESAEKRENFKTCISGEYPALCRHSLLTEKEIAQVRAAERRVNYQTCISGEYSALCNHSLLASEQSAKVAAAERRARNR